MIVEKMLESCPAERRFMKGTLLSAAAMLAFATAGHASELSEVEAQAKQLRDENQVLTKRLADLERRQRKLEAKTAGQTDVAIRQANPVGSMAADYNANKT